MKYFIIAALAAISFSSCSAKKAVENPDNLPKDISLKPERTYEEDQKNMLAMRAEIESMINAETCSDTSDWRLSPIGSKPCGGPNAYIAYPIKIEEKILPKIKAYTEVNSAYNKKRGLMSDCALVTSPSGINCENGRAVLASANSAVSEVH
ncbi:MAG: hypothetical protein K0M56_10675 [Kaistella sp.]|nr:hypothetical protein [Kaistella sp.]